MAQMEFNRLNEDAFRDLLIALCFWVCNVAFLLPFSIFYHDHILCKVMWWISWILSIPAGALALLWFFVMGCFIGTDYREWKRISPPCSYRLIMFILPHVGFWPAFLFAGWWLLANPLNVEYANMKRDVEPKSIADMYNSDDPPDSYLMKYGFVAELPVQGSLEPQSLRMSSSFTFKCHGSRTCIGDCTVSNCACGVWTYPDDCFGYDLISAAPLYEDTVEDGSSGMKPSAIAYRVHTYLFDQDPSAMNAHFQSKLNEPFPARFCADSKICLLDLRSTRIEDYWSDYGNWGKTTIGHPGIHQYNNLSVENGRKLATRMITMSGQTHGIPLTDAPLLWMPPGVRRTFEDFDESFKDAEEEGNKAKILICLATTVPCGFIILCICFIAYSSPWTPGGDCWDRILCLKSETKVEPVKRPEEDPQPDPEEPSNTNAATNQVDNTNVATNQVEPYEELKEDPHAKDDKLRQAATAQGTGSDATT